MKHQRSIAVALVAGIAYGVAGRALMAYRWNEFTPLLTLGFLFLVPFAAGFVSSFLAAREGQHGGLTWFWLPLVNTAALLAGAWLFRIEGLICIVLLSPLAFGMAMLGGATGFLFARRSGGGPKPLLCVGLLPFLVTPAELWIGPTLDIREVRTSIDIAAPPETIWRHIERVAPIRPEEQPFSWTQAIGFPRPLEATLSKEGVGGVRHATFAGGVLFVETVTAWDPPRRLTFNIRANTESIPPTTLDEHVTIGGPYFDALEGEYRLESLGAGRVRLHLSSRHRLSTTVNFYASLWTDAIMRDIQNNILHVIRTRCERHP